MQTNLTNMVWIDQPAGAGFSPGPPTVKNEIDVAHQFNDFWKNFMDTFNLHNRKVYVAGESYAGQYIPYIVNDMLNRKDKKYFNVKGVQIIDPSINEDDVIIEGSQSYLHCVDKSSTNTLQPLRSWPSTTSKTSSTLTLPSWPTSISALTSAVIPTLWKTLCSSLLRENYQTLPTPLSRAVTSGAISSQQRTTSTRALTSTISLTSVLIFGTSWASLPLEEDLMTTSIAPTCRLLFMHPRRIT